MTYPDAIAYLYGLINYERTPAQMATARYLNLTRMREALARAGDPHRQVRCVHLAGTKGKGSTAAMTAAMLQAAGLRVGLYTSPHLVEFTERLRIDGLPIPEAALAALVEEVQPLVDAMRATPGGAPTYFEVATLLAFRWFAREGVEIAVLETGLGGRLDATNVVRPVVTALTTIALDHTTELGDTLALIAAEKAGILKPGVPVVSAPQHPEAVAMIARIAGEQGSPLYQVGRDLRVTPGAGDLHGQYFSITGRLGAYTDLYCPLLGAHQQRNAAVAVGIAECLHEQGIAVPPSAIRAGLATVRWPGRLQVMSRAPLLLLDGAHDPASIDALLAALAQYAPDKQRWYLVGFAREKDWRQMLQQLAPTAHTLVLTAANTPRAVPPEELAVAVPPGIPVLIAPDVSAALTLVRARAQADDLICATGSLYVVGDVLRMMG